jgi:hypothetical protein
MKRLLIALLIAIPIGTIAAAIAWQIVMESALEPTCSDEVLSEQKSPNGILVLSVYKSNCGATTDFAMTLSIRRASDDFDPSANNAVLVIDGDVPMTASWIDVDSIEVVIPKDAEIYRRDQDWNGVTISYVAN